ncbi:hypothetical protein V1264_007952 [Littorina saxatilis]|uniref:Uncharacterized protein n=1 Tax=Littorina saxatilis TaxID=31220 RepID=A0AAN9AWA8_9CAEN
MKQHVITVCQAGYYKLKRIASIRHFLTEETTTVLVTSCILSRTDYCNSLLSGVPVSMIQPLQTLQNFAARLVCKAGRTQHCTPLLFSLHWLPVAQRIKYKICCLCFKVIINSTPLYLSQLLQVYSPSLPLPTPTSVLPLSTSPNSYKCTLPLYLSQLLQVSSPSLPLTTPTSVLPLSTSPNSYKCTASLYLSQLLQVYSPSLPLPTPTSVLPSLPLPTPSVLPLSTSPNSYKCTPPLPTPTSVLPLSTSPNSYKCTPPIYLSQLLQVHSPSRTTRSSQNTRRFKVVRFKRKQHGFRSFSHFGFIIWIELPYNVRNSQSLPSFKTNLKTHLFKHFVAD